MIGRITVYLQQPSKYSIRSVAPSIKQLRLNLRIFMSPCSYAATTATSQVIVLTKRHFLALSNLDRRLTYVFNIVCFMYEVKSFLTLFITFLSCYFITVIKFTHCIIMSCRSHPLSFFIVISLHQIKFFSAIRYKPNKRISSF